MTQIVEQITKPPPDALVLNRCGACGEIVDDQMILARYQGRKYCDNCNAKNLPQPWSRDDFYDDDDEYEAAPDCGHCGSTTFIATFERPNGVLVECEVSDHDWCEDHAVYHLEFGAVVPEADDAEDDPVYRSARCSDCDRPAYVSYDWEA